jgi:hypothetical protein
MKLAVIFSFLLMCLIVASSPGNSKNAKRLLGIDLGLGIDIGLGLGLGKKKTTTPAPTTASILRPYRDVANKIIGMAISTVYELIPDDVIESAQGGIDHYRELVHTMATGGINALPLVEQQHLLHVTNVTLAAFNCTQSDHDILMQIYNCIPPNVTGDPMPAPRPGSLAEGESVAYLFCNALYRIASEIVPAHYATDFIDRYSDYIDMAFTIANDGILTDSGKLDLMNKIQLGLATYFGDLQIEEYATVSGIYNNIALTPLYTMLQII